MPAARLFYLLAFSTLLVTAGVVVPLLARLAVALDTVFLAAFAVDYLRVRRASLTAGRRWPPLLVQGSAAEIEVELVNPGSRRLRVRLREALHPGLAEAPRRAEQLLPVGARSTWTYEVRPRRRGEHPAGPLSARLLGPWGLAWAERDLILPERVRVYPQVRFEGKVGHLLLLAHRHALGQRAQPRRGLGREPYGLREYLPGDPPNRIHWKATARHGRPVTREESWERGARLLILLDCGRAMAPAAGERSKLDHALAASLALARVAAGRGDRVSFVAFSDRVERTLRLRSGSRGLHAAYGGLYDLEARLAEPAFDIAAEVASGLESRRSTVVLFTSVVDLAAAELLRQAVLRLERRHRPILINLEDPDIVALAHDPPQKATDVFAQTAALEILLANRRLGKHLRHAGVRVVNAPADRLALETLEAYLEMFG